MPSQRHPALCRRFPLLLVLLSLGGAGCSSSSEVRVDKPLDPTHERLVKICMAYVRFSAEEKTPPQNAKELKPFLAELGNADENLAIAARRTAVCRLLGRRHDAVAGVLGPIDARGGLRETGRRRPTLCHHCSVPEAGGPVGPGVSPRQFSSRI